MLTLIVNPAAGSGFALRMKEKLEEVLAANHVPHKILHTAGPGDATRLAHKAAAEPDCTGVVAVGGDGTCCETACGLLGTGVPLGIIPAGTGNDFIKSVHLPKDPMAALDIILKGNSQPIDVGRLNDRMFMNVCGTGFDVQTLEFTQKAKKYARGILPYMIGLLRAIFSFRPVHVSFTVDGVTQERDVLLCSIANGKYIGGGIPVCPSAQPDDGLLDMVIVETRPRWKIPFYLPGLMLGRIDRFKVTTHQRCSTMRIQSKGMRLNVDGEILPMDEADFEIMQGKLLLFR